MSSGGNTNSNYTNGFNQVYLSHINSVDNGTSSIFVNGNAPTTFATGAIVSAQTNGLDSTHAGILSKLKPTKKAKPLKC